MPISSIAPSPSEARIARSRSTAISGIMLPIVEPGKKPSLGVSATSAGSVSGRMKSASNGRTFRSGNASASTRDDSRRKSPEMSIGT